MKFTFSVYAVLFFVTICTRAQVSYGIFGGIQQTDAHVKIPGGPAIPAASGYGFHAGSMLKVGFDKNVYFSPGLLYSLKGVTIHFNNILQDSVTSSKLQIHYIEIPLLLRFDTRANGNGFFFLFGPSASVAITGKESSTYLNNSKKDRPMRFANTAYGRFEMNLVAKAGYYFKNNVLLAGGYSYGLGSIINDDGYARIVPRMITLSVGYFFRKK
ncbi:porin family protein [Agriterribacter sp.]|uniref:porin family protein n=1 Tax=Agriterribacter sp. TaxID=2821509 RepID=UPI002C01954B|nr:porin family protein [Agriterribacter sp.]HTN07398.1 porin family protein [Agriterribacter sp.]